MLKLYQFEPKYGLPNVSPFCMKVETFLRMAKIQFAMQFIHDPRKAPKGKLPFINDDGEIIADSAFILDHLTKKYQVTLDRDLSAHKRGIARMIDGMLEERLYFALLYFRWGDDDNWSKIRELWFSHLPPIIRKIVPPLVRKGVLKNLAAQGIGRHSPDEIKAIGIKDLQGLVDLLGDQKFMLGNEPTSIDAAAFSMLACILYVPLPNPLLDFAKEQHSLVDYCKRMGAKFYPDYAVFQ